MFGITIDIVWTVVIVITMLLFVLVESFLLWRQKSPKLLGQVLIGFIAIQSMSTGIFMWLNGQYFLMIFALSLLFIPAYYLYLVFIGRGDEIVQHEMSTIDEPPMRSFRLAKIQWSKKKS